MNRCAPRSSHTVSCFAALLLSAFAALPLLPSIVHGESVAAPAPQAAAPEADASVSEADAAAAETAAGLLTPESDRLFGSLGGPREDDSADAAGDPEMGEGAGDGDGLGDLVYQGPDGIRPEPRPEGRPLTLYRNAMVDSLVRYFTERKRDVLERGWRRSGRYMAMIREVFQEEGVPVELAYLAAVESNYNPTARSRAGAVGLWQFMPATGRKFGLRMHRPWYDERLDPETSTHAAARLLAYLYDRYESWELALAAYNAGESRVNRAIRHARATGRSTDYWKLRLPGQTRGYVPAFLAIAAIMEAPETHGLADIPKEPPVPSEALNIEISATLTDLSQRLALPDDTLAALNPAWKTRMIPPLEVGPVLLRVPPNTAERLVADLRREAPRAIPWLVHRVREGDTISELAQQYNVRARDVLSMNGMHWRSLLHIGQPLLMPLPADGEAPRSAAPMRPLIAAPEHGVAPAVSQMHLHRVRAGESLWTISRQYNVRMTDLRLWNRLPSAVLQPDQELVVFLRDNWTAAR